MFLFLLTLQAFPIFNPIFQAGCLDQFGTVCVVNLIVSKVS